MKNKIFQTACCSIIALLSFLSVPARAEVIDKMDADTFSTWTNSKADNTTLTLSNVQGGYQETCMKATYNLTNGDWVAFGKPNLGNGDFSGGDSLSITYRGAGDNNNIELKFIDSDGDIFVAILEKATNTGNNWVTSTISHDNFSLWRNPPKPGETEGEPFGNGTKDWGKIVKYAINVTRSSGGEGYIEVDTIHAYQQKNPSIEVVDACEGSNNNYNSDVWEGADGANGATYSIVPSEENTYPSPMGGKYRKLAYTFSGTWAVLWEENMYAVTRSSLAAIATANINNLKYINFYMKLENGTEKPVLQLLNFVSGTGGVDRQKEANVLDYKKFDCGTAYPGWGFYSIPLTAFDFTVPTSTTAYIFRIKFAVLEPSAGTVYLDHLFYSEFDNASLAGGTDSGEVAGFNDDANLLTYPTSKDRENVYTPSSVSLSSTNKALRLDFKFNDGDWMVCEKGTGLNAAAARGFRFRYKGTGAANHLEFKVKDRNNVEYFKKFYAFTNTDGEWKTAIVQMKELTLFGKGKDNNETLDLKNIAEVNFAISKNGAGGDGTFYIDYLETVSEKDFELARPGRMIESVSIDNNPFSPNGDSIKDAATFSYTLTDYANVKLDIYNMAGEIVRKIDVGDQVPASYATLQWDGKNDDGGVVNNGPFFYKLSAKNPDNQSDSVTHLIFVLK